MIIGLGILISTGYIIYVTSQKKKQNKYLRTLKDPDTKVPLPLMEKQIINHDTRKYRFQLPTENHVLGNYYMCFFYKVNRSNQCVPPNLIHFDSEVT